MSTSIRGRRRIVALSAMGGKRTLRLRRLASFYVVCFCPFLSSGCGTTA